MTRRSRNLPVGPYLRYLLFPMTLLVSCRQAGDEVDAVRVVSPTIDLTIGTFDGPDEYTFGRVSGLAADAEGRIYVADGQAHAVRVYDSNGLFRETLAGPGAGPGEVDGPCCLAIGPEGRLWIRNAGNARYNWYDLDSAMPRTGSLRMAHGHANYGVAATFGIDGHLIDVGREMGPEGLDAIVRYHRDSTDAVAWQERVSQPPADSLAVHRVRNGLSISYVYQPFGPHHLVAHSPDGTWATAVSSRYAVQWIRSARGDTIVIARAHRGPAVSPAERETAQSQMAEDAAWAGITAAALPFTVPSHKAPLRALQFDQLGRLWVHLVPAEGEPSTTDVYGTEGQLAFRVSWPAAIRMTNGFIGDNFALGVRRDSLNVQYVVRLRW